MQVVLADGQEILEGRFTIQKKLGSGAFGEIYKGKQSFRLKSARPEFLPNLESLFWEILEYWLILIPAMLLITFLFHQSKRRRPNNSMLPRL